MCQKAKNYLLQIKRLEQEAEVLRRLMNQAKVDAASLSSSALGEKVQTSACGDNIVNVVAKIIDLEKDYERKLNKLYELKDKIYHQIDSLDNTDYRTLLKLRYISLLTFEEMAVEMHYTYQWTCVLHGRALQEFENKFIRIDSN